MSTNQILENFKKDGVDKLLEKHQNYRKNLSEDKKISQLKWRFFIVLVLSHLIVFIFNSSASSAPETLPASTFSPPQDHLSLVLPLDLKTPLSEFGTKVQLIHPLFQKRVTTAWIEKQIADELGPTSISQALEYKTYKLWIKKDELDEIIKKSRNQVFEAYPYNNSSRKKTQRKEYEITF